MQAVIHLHTYLYLSEVCS